MNSEWNTKAEPISEQGNRNSSSTIKKILEHHTESASGCTPKDSLLKARFRTIIYDCITVTTEAV